MKKNIIIVLLSIFVGVSIGMAQVDVKTYTSRSGGLNKEYSYAEGQTIQIKIWKPDGSTKTFSHTVGADMKGELRITLYLSDK